MDQPPLLNFMCFLIGMRGMDLNKWYELGQHKRTVTAVLPNGHVTLTRCAGDGSVTVDEVISHGSEAVEFNLDELAKAAFDQPDAVFSFGGGTFVESRVIVPRSLGHKRYVALSLRSIETRERMWAAFEDALDNSELDEDDFVHLSCHGLICVGSCYRIYWPEKRDDESGLTWEMMKSAVDVAEAFVVCDGAKTTQLRDAIFRCDMTPFAKVADTDAMAKTVFRVIANVYKNYVQHE